MDNAVPKNAAHAEIAPSIDIDPFSDAFLSDPYAYHAALRDAAPAVFLPSYGVFAVARYDEVTTALKDHEGFCSGRGVGLSDFAQEEPWRPPSLLLETDPPVHDQMRAIMNRIVSPVALKQLRERWTAEAVNLIEELVERRRFDAVVDLAEVFPMRVFPDTIGLRDDGREQLLVYASATFNAFGPRNALAVETAAAAGDALRWVDEACRRENLKPGGWGMAVYEAADAGRCSAAEAHRLVRSFLSAGVDTTVNGLGNMLAAFVAFPDQWERLRDEPALKKKAFEEALRWDSTAQTFFRTTTKDVVLGGTRIPGGAKVLLFLAAANRDPRRWDKPERFQIDRMTSGHVGFGFGLHQCLGQMVARLEAEVVLDAMIPRIRALRAAGPPVRRLNNTLHALASLPVSIETA